MEAYGAFEGRIGRTMAGSEPWWPPRRRAPEGAPNVVVMLCDDLGFADLGCFGSEIDTPQLDRLAAEGVRYTNFHATPMCSPTRAALLTGVNPHAAGVGHIANSDPGFPGYAEELAADVITMAEILRHAGWSTLIVGKWHLCKDSDVTASGAKHSWPLQRGFDRFYGFLDAFTNFHHPHHLVEDNHALAVDRYPDGYYLTDDLTDHAIGMVREEKASDPTKPLFLYFAHGAVHAPLQAKRVDMEKYRGVYQAGWDRLRQSRYLRQQQLGVVVNGVALAPRNTEPDHDVRPWDDLAASEKRLFSRYMEVYAAMVDNVDQNFGRLRVALEELGQWDNTLVLFMSDNGASREGEASGTSQYFRKLRTQFGFADEGFDDDLARIDLIGGPQTLPHYPRGWAMASNTPFRLYKVNTHAGGHSVPMILSWPAGLGDGGGLRRQYTHVTDVLPTICDLVGVEPLRERAGVATKPLAGASFAASLADASVESSHREQYYEMVGHRGYYRDGWEVVTLHHPKTPFGDHEWELYHLAEDPTELSDVASRHPEQLLELAAAWDQAAWANQVYPLDEGSRLRWLQRGPHEGAFSEPVTIIPGTPTLERYRSLRLIAMRNFTVTVQLDFRSGDRGVLVAHGDQGGGYVLYIDDDELIYEHNGFGTMATLRGGRLPLGEQEVVLDVVAPGGFVWTVGLVIGGSRRAEVTGLPLFFGMCPFQGIDVGVDRRSPVSWRLHQREGGFAYHGALHAVTYTPGELAPDNGERFIDLLRQVGARYE